MYIEATDPTLRHALLLLHGTGGSEDDLMDLGRSLLPGAAILSVRGRVQEGGMTRWFRRYAEGVFDTESIRIEAAELASFLERIYKELNLDKSVIAVGYSNGANMAASLLMLHPDVIDGIVMWRGMNPIDPDKQPNLTGKSALLINGSKDLMGPIDSAKTLADKLSLAGAKVEWVVLETGHNLTAADFELTTQWIQEKV
jgi:phospholipase/carboxylesterase